MAAQIADRGLGELALLLGQQPPHGLELLGDGGLEALEVACEVGAAGAVECVEQALESRGGLLVVGEGRGGLGVLDLRGGGVHAGAHLVGIGLGERLLDGLGGGRVGGLQVLGRPGHLVFQALHGIAEAALRAGQAAGDALLVGGEVGGRLAEELAGQVAGALGELLLFEQEFAGHAHEVVDVGPAVEACEGGVEFGGDALLACGGVGEVLALLVGGGFGLCGGGEASGCLGHLLVGKRTQSVCQLLDAAAVFEVADLVVLHVAEGLGELLGGALRGGGDAELLALSGLEGLALGVRRGLREAAGGIGCSGLAFGHLVDPELDLLETALDERRHLGLADDREAVGGGAAGVGAEGLALAFDAVAVVGLGMHVQHVAFFEGERREVPVEGLHEAFGGLGGVGEAVRGGLRGLVAAEEQAGAHHAVVVLGHDADGHGGARRDLAAGAGSGQGDRGRSVGAHAEAVGGGGRVGEAVHVGECDGVVSVLGLEEELGSQVGGIAVEGGQARGLVVVEEEARGGVAGGNGLVGANLEGGPRAAEGADGAAAVRDHPLGLAGVGRGVQGNAQPLDAGAVADAHLVGGRARVVARGVEGEGVGHAGEVGGVAGVAGVRQEASAGAGDGGAIVHGHASRGAPQLAGEACGADDDLHVLALRHVEGEALGHEGPLVLVVGQHGELGAAGPLHVAQRMEQAGGENGGRGGELHHEKARNDQHRGGAEAPPCSRARRDGGLEAHAAGFCQRVAGELGDQVGRQGRGVARGGQLHGGDEPVAQRREAPLDDECQVFIGQRHTQGRHHEAPEGVEARDAARGEQQHAARRLEAHGPVEHERAAEHRHGHEHHAAHPGEEDDPPQVGAQSGQLVL